MTTPCFNSPQCELYSVVGLTVGSLNMSSEWVALILCGCYGLTVSLGACLLTDHGSAITNGCD